MQNDQTKKAEKLAHYEVEWWKAHHRREQGKLIDLMSKLYELQFGINYEDAQRAVGYRVEAGKFHDKAEELEDAGKQDRADRYWDKAEQELVQHFEILKNLTD